MIWRHFSALGTECEVVAPSSIPKRAGGRVKTDRRDALQLALLSRDGNLTAVRVPSATDEAVREQRNARHRLKALLLRNCIPYTGKSNLTAAQLRWLATVNMAHPAEQIEFQDYLHGLIGSRHASPGWSRPNWMRWAT